MQKINNYRESLQDFRQAVEASATRLRDFRKNEKFQGPLELFLVQLDSFPECRDLVSALIAFQAAALVFKDNAADELRRMLMGDGHWAETRRTDPDEYHRRKEQELEEVRIAYLAAMAEIVKASMVST